MAIDSFFATQVTAQTGASAKPGIPGGKATGVSMQGGLAFFDLFLANAEKAIDLRLQALQTKPATNAQPLQSANPLLSTETNLNITEALANSAYTMEELKKIDEPQLSDIMALNQQVSDEQLLTIEIPGTPEGVSNALQNAIITSEPDFRPALNNLQRILQKLEKLVETDSSALIGTNVTPEQITALQKKVDDLLNGITPEGKTEAEEFAGIFAGLISILPPQTKADASAQKPAVITAASATAPSSPDIPAGTLPANDLAAKLNNLIVGGSEDGEEPAQQQQQQTAPALPKDGKPQGEAQMQAQTRNTGEKWTLPESFKNLTDDEGDIDLSVKDGAVKTDGKTGGNNVPSAVMAQAKPQNSVSPDLSLLKASMPFLYGGFDPATGLYSGSAPMADSMSGLQLAGFSAVTQGAATSLLTHASHAALPHPGTQMVAAQLQKSGNAGQNSTMTLQLDPPELGRVEIKMSFEKNSKIKAVLTVEKPETHAMLQRDSSVLERALQDAGLDSEGGLSFELAKEGYTFGRDDGQGGSGGEHGRRAASEADEEMIQTTLNWAVDPETGHMHYNILA